MCLLQIESDYKKVNNKFNNQAIIELLTLNFALIPKYAYKIFDIIRYVFGNLKKKLFFSIKTILN